MKAELTPQEVAERLEEIAIMSHDVEAVKQAASIVRKVANGEYAPAVRCGECKFWLNDGIHITGRCGNLNIGGLKLDSDFCSFGVRKDGVE